MATGSFLRKIKKKNCVLTFYLFWKKIEIGWLNWMSESYEGSRRLSSSSRRLRCANSCSDKVVTLIICGLQLLGHLHVGLNNTSTGLRLTAWPTAGIILTTTQEQEQETVRTPELFKSYGAPCGWKVTLHMVFTNYLLKTENWQRWDQNLKCFLADHIQLLTPPPHEPASSPVVVSVTECPDRDGEGLPHGVQVVLDHLGLVADSKPGDTWETSSWFMWRDVNVASRRNLLAHVRQNKLVPCTSLMGLLGDEHWANLEASRAISNNKNNQRFLCWQITN